MSRIVLTADGTPRSLAAVRAAIASRGVEHVELVSVQPAFNRHIADRVGRRERDAWRRERAFATLVAERSLLDRTRISYSVRVVCGRPRALAGRICVPAGLGVLALLMLADA